MVLKLQEEEMEREERENERKRKEKEKSERVEKEKHKVNEKEKDKVDLKFDTPEAGSMRLPERMPSELEAMVKDITKVAREGLGKSKFFLANGESIRTPHIHSVHRCPVQKHWALVPPRSMNVCWLKGLSTGACFSLKVSARDCYPLT